MCRFRPTCRSSSVSIGTISYLPDLDDSLRHAFGSIDDQYDYVYGFDCRAGAQTYDPVRPPGLNDLVCLKPGHGYWVKMANAATLTYPTSGYLCDELSPPMKLANPTNVVTPTPWICDFWSYGSVDGPAEGSVLTVRDEHHTVCGQAMVLEGGMFMVHVYGDDPQTEIDEGAVEGTRLTFECDGEEYEVTGDNSWSERTSIEITLSRPGHGAPVPNAYELSQNYPNPFNAGTVIAYSLKDAGYVSLEVYDILGRPVKMLVNGIQSAGQHTTTWNGLDDNGNAVASGTYFYRLTTGNDIQARKMILMK